ncbi:MFS transporter [Larkinella sp. VNQ87]|uniref:MFS transporter n=1 Tax=Larkinella sp. VNQ87 TaxID=3400921 RepID=UPI003C102687
MITRKNILLITASLGVFVEALDIAIINLAMPLIQKEIALNDADVQWLQTLYLLSYGGLLIVGGKLTDTFGRRPIFLVGSLLFLVTSLGAGFATSFAALAFFRVVQGIAAALVMPSAFSIISNAFTDATERSKALAIFSSFAAVGSGSGLSVGGLIATYLGWQWVFFINVPILLLTISMAYLHVTDEKTAQPKAFPDILSGLLITVLIGILTYLVHELVHLKDHPGRTLGLVGALVAGGLWFCARLRHQPEPLIDFSVLRGPNTRTGNGVVLLLGAFFSGYLFLVSLIAQKSMHYTAAEAGLFLFPFSFASIFLSKTLLPYLFRTLSSRGVAILGMSLMTTGGLLLFGSVQGGSQLFLLLLSAACVTGSGMLICFTSLMGIAVQDVPRDHHGLASGITNTCYFFGAGLGLSVLAIFISASSGENRYELPTLVLTSYAVLGIIWLLASRSKKHSKPAPLLEDSLA